MLDLKAETPLTLTQAARLVPLTRLDRPAPVRTVLRWVRHGVRGVRLEAVRIGGRWVTTPEALERFTSTLTDRGDANRRVRDRGDGPITWPTGVEVAADPDPDPALPSADGVAAPGG